MSDAFIYSLGSVLIVSAISLVGVFTLSLSTKKLSKILIYMISFAAGGLLGDAFLHLLPEMAHENGFGVDSSLYILGGIVFSFVIEKVIHWRHCHHPTCDSHPHPFAIMNLIGDGVHNFIDGLIIGASYLVSIPVGIATTVAVILHEIPQEIGDFGVLIYGGFSKGKALFLNFLTALTAVLGVLAVFAFSSYTEMGTAFLIPFAAGTFIYIAVADLIPELHKEVAVKRSLLQLFFFVLGIFLMLAMMYVPGHSHGHDENVHAHEHVEEVHVD